MTVPDLLNSLALPVIAAPMTDVSGPELVIAACRAGVVGAFPAHNAASTPELHSWLGAITRAATAGSAPLAVNLIVHRSNDRLDADLDVLIEHRVPIVITSVGSPVPVLDRLHDAGALVFADVSSLRHVQRAVDAGVDGLVLLCSGAGGQTGTASPLAFVPAVRARFDGPIAVAGGIADGRALWAAQVLGADLGYLGTSFITTHESLAAPEFKAALIGATLDDIVTTSGPSGLPANFLREWLAAHDIEPDTTGSYHQRRLFAHKNVWSAGHSVSAVTGEQSTAALVAQLAQQYHAAREAGVRTATPPIQTH
ncbi:nitronate monooxygenase family protein [Nocardia sp. NRRL WC-3656]|uniref:NAD(P)H-dependent flavin oxidoreductase n=1 Tax=Nocardia sp. NRRL WC-3656 TaxID=1463824 RepID=UPI0004C3760C|nr:nitronate monooxygenase [Nocardia sp. NRRL WC-3656]